MRNSALLLGKLIAHINRKEWWHVPPRDQSTYRKRGKFLAACFSEAEFWGRPLDEPQGVAVTNPLVGDEETIERKLLGRRMSGEDIGLDERWALDAKIKRAALARGYDCIVLMTPQAFAEFKIAGKLPHSIELNILNPQEKRFPRRRRLPPPVKPCVFRAPPPFEQPCSN